MRRRWARIPVDATARLTTQSFGEQHHMLQFLAFLFRYMFKQRMAVAALWADIQVTVQARVHEVGDS